MAVENLQDIIDAINNGAAPKRASLRAALVGLLNAGDLADLIEASANPKKQQLAIQNGLATDLLNGANAAAAQAASDARRVVALAFIASDIIPLLTDPTAGDYVTQHGQILNNISIINGFIEAAPDAEHREEEIALRLTWRNSLRTLKQQHAQGLIT